MATKLTFKRGPAAGLANLGIVDGQLIFTVDNGRIYLDNGSTRIQMFKDVIDDAAKLKAEVAKLLGGKVDDNGDIVADPDVASVADQIATAVATEKARAEAEEKKLADAIGTASVPAEGETAAVPATGAYIAIEKNAADIKAIQEALGGTGEEGEDASLTEKVAANELAIKTLNGYASETDKGDTGKSVRAIAAEETAKIVANAPENLDTLKEIADFITGEGEDAANLANKVTVLETAVGKAETAEGADDATGLMKTTADNTKAIADEATRAKAAEKANADAITVLNGADTVEGSIAKAIKDALEGGDGLVWGDFAAAATE
ncbi:MAG: hypothetical protein NC218_09600 [Acetobacter sp.]|nr:hypothetical protein [Acetobacter sp.]